MKHGYFWELTTVKLEKILLKMAVHDIPDILQMLCRVKPVGLE